MTVFFIVLVLALLVAQFVLPRRLAFVPLLIATCHFQNVAVLDVGVSFSICKLVILAGLTRVVLERALFSFARHPMDLWVVAWGGWMILSGLAHNPTDHNPLTIRLSVIYDFAGTYLYARSFLRDREDFVNFCRCLALVVLPMAAAVLAEKATHRNIYGIISGGVQVAEVRQGHVRAVGAFGHSILLGTFAATCIPLLVVARARNSKLALWGIVACLVIIIGSASSGPIISFLSAMAGLALWRWRSRVGLVRKLAIGGLIGLHLIMEAPVWYLMARIDVVGGSTGWHRAELITAALRHFEDWWLIGTDYTRDWIAYGVQWSARHIDITNEYIAMGVNGGLLLMLLFIVILAKAFQSLGRAMRALRETNDPGEFVLWCVGACLFAHCVTFLSIAYFDQSNVTFALVLGGVPGLSRVLQQPALEPALKVPDPNIHACAPPVVETERPATGSIEF